MLTALGGARAATSGQQATNDATPSGAELPAASIDDSRPPLWSFAWLSDMHLGTATPEFIAQALHHVDTLKAHFLLITGDNNFLEAAPADPKSPSRSGCGGSDS